MSVSEYCVVWEKTGSPCQRGNCVICREALRCPHFGERDSTQGTGFCPCHVTCSCRSPGAKCHKLKVMPVPQAPISPPPVGGMEAKGTKLDVGKLRFDLVPVRAMTMFVAVLSFGAKKYGANNWRNLIGWRWRYVGAGLRHIFAYMGGERTDPESRFHHLSHALCCFFFILDNELALEANLVVPDGDAIPPELSSKETSDYKLSAQCVTHEFKPTDPEAYGSPCLICGAQGIEHHKVK